MNTPHAPSRGELRHTRKRRRISYFEGDSDSGSGSPFSPDTRFSQPTRQSRRIRSYKEDSENSDENTDTEPSKSSHARSEAYASHSGQTRVRPTALRSSVKPHKADVRSANNTTFTGFQRRKAGTRAHTLHQKVNVGGLLLPKSSTCPPWQELEYQILVRIFKFAALPLFDGASYSSSAISWLLDVSLLSRAIHAASIAALFLAPPVLSASCARSLVSLLGQDQQMLSTNYGTKIRRLDIDVKAVLVKKGGISLPELIDKTPLLTDLRLYHQHDNIKAIWAQPPTTKGKYSYPDNLFDCLDKNNIVLRSFEWNGRFPLTMSVLETMGRMHSRPCLRSLSKLSLVNLNLPEKTTAKPQAEGLLLHALGMLHDLRGLEFRNCNIADDALISQLDVELDSLSFVECGNFTSDPIHEYLAGHGHALTELNLVSNQALDLGFMADLASLTPRLQHLKVDLSYTDASSYHDTEPHFDELLPCGRPTWPEKLVTIDVAHLRNLTTMDAEGFLSSLVESSSKLLDLREINIKAILKQASWRDRAAMRKKWEVLFQKVFSARPSEPISRASNHNSRSKHQRQSARLALNDQKDSDSGSSSDLRDTDLTLEGVPLVRQGRCSKAVLVFDAQRPSDTLFTMADFVDDLEASEEEEWNGDTADGAGYAW